MGKEKAAKPKAVKVGASGVKLSKTSAKEGGAFNPAIEETVVATSITAASPEEEHKGRDFSGDLREYVEGWKVKDTVTWKFNKVLQAWALSNTFDKNKIDDTLFKQLCPYLQSVQGGARTRLLEAAVTIGEEEEAAMGDGDDDSASIRKKRAKKIIKLLKSK